MFGESNETWLEANYTTVHKHTKNVEFNFPNDKRKNYKKNHVVSISSVISLFLYDPREKFLWRDYNIIIIQYFLFWKEKFEWVTNLSTGSDWFILFFDRNSFFE